MMTKASQLRRELNHRAQYLAECVGMWALTSDEPVDNVNNHGGFILIMVGGGDFHALLHAGDVYAGPYGKSDVDPDGFVELGVGYTLSAEDVIAYCLSPDVIMAAIERRKLNSNRERRWEERHRDAAERRRKQNLEHQAAVRLRRRRELARERQARKRRRDGAEARAAYEAQSISRNKPWEALGISRASWYRRRRANPTAEASGTSPCAT